MTVVSPEPASFLEAFTSMFHRRELPVPPVPPAAAALVQPIAEDVFASEDVPTPWLSFPSLELPLLTDLAKRQAADTVFFLCGFTGTGLQNRSFHYLYSGAGLHVGLALPLDCVYADTDQERLAVLTAVDLLKLCFVRTQEGKQLGHPEASDLYWSADSYGLRYCLVTRQGETLREADGVDALLDYLEQCRPNATGPDGKPGTWLRI